MPDPHNPLIHWKHDGVDVYVGAETAKLYSRKQLEELGKQAGGTVIFLSKADEKLLNDPSHPLALPPSLHYPKDLTGVYRDLTDDQKTSQLYYFTDAQGKVNGGVTLLSPPNQGVNLSRVDRPGQTDTPDFNKETWLFGEAHEVSHIGSAMGGTAVVTNGMIFGVTDRNDGDINADLGAYDFVRKHRKEFPTLGDPAKSDAIVAGGRALGYLSVPSALEADLHNGTAFYNSRMTNADNRTGDEAAFGEARLGVIGKVAPFLAAQGLLKANGLLDRAMDMAVDKIKYDALPEAEKRAHGPGGSPPDVDSAGVVKRYLTNLGITDLKGNDAELALAKLEIAARDFNSPDAERRQNALKYIAEGKLTAADAQTLGKELQGYLAPQTLESQFERMQFSHARPDDPLLARFVASVEKFHKQGAFTDPLQRQFAENLIAGGSYYLDPKALATARAEVAAGSTAGYASLKKFDADIATALTPGPAETNRPNYGILNAGIKIDAAPQAKPETKAKPLLAARTPLQGMSADI